MNGKRLLKLLKINALHALYREDGRWYHHLKKFPGVLFDKNGYMVFYTKEEYEKNSFLVKQKDLHITNGIATLVGYKKFNQEQLKIINPANIYRPKLATSDSAWHIFLAAARIAQSEKQSFSSPILEKSYSVNEVTHRNVIIGRESGKDSIIQYSFFFNRINDINAYNGAIGRKDIKGHIAKISAIVYLHPQLEWADNFETIVVTIKTQETKLLAVAKVDLDAFEEENSDNFEGKKGKRLVSYYERRPHLRAKAISIHGTRCVICKFNFKEHYGKHGEDYIEVHHLVPISKLIDPTEINPETDMTVLCANCHRMAHRSKSNPLSVAELRNIWNEARGKNIKQ